MNNKYPGNLSKTRLYRVWYAMRARCYLPRTPEFPRYGGQGISVCEEWRNNFLAFRMWALGSGYSDDLEIDRKDSSGNYEPENCRWATRSQQNQNLRKTSKKCVSRFKGVGRHEPGARKQWFARISPGGKPISLGSFQTEEEAARAYDAKARELFGEFAKTNFNDGLDNVLIHRQD